jgi:hypothetical protein
LANDEEVKDAVHTWLQMQPKIFFADGISKPVDLSNKFVEQLGDYIEKL